MAANDPPGQSLAGATLLIVDDEPLLSLTMSLVLRREGAVVVTAANGQLALSLLEAPHRFDAMVCDQNMPVMDGLTLLRILHERSLGLPTLFFNSSIDPHDVLPLEALGVQGLLSKPIQPSDLVAAIAAVVVAR